MSPSRREFLKSTAAAGVAVPVVGAGSIEAHDPTAGQEQECRTGKMTHSILEEDHPYIYIDSCMQMWPDGDFHLAHRHGVTAAQTHTLLVDNPRSVFSAAHRRRAMGGNDV